MKKRYIWFGLSFLMVTALLLSSCATTTTPSTSASTTPSTSTITTSTTKTTSIATTITTTTATTTATTGNWWDSLGTPQYGGELDLRVNADIGYFDSYVSYGQMGIQSGWYEKLYADDWTLNPNTFSYTIDFRPSTYVNGDLAVSWEFQDPSTYVVHLRQGIHWQNIPPVNGREFTADDVAYHFDRYFGLGDGFTKPSPAYVGVAAYLDIISVTATEKYTVVYKFKTPSPENIMETLMSLSNELEIVPREPVEQWGNVTDWHHQIGTGPFTLEDYVSGSSATLAKYPNYWGYDERYPQNELPYVDKIVYLIIPDTATALAAMRAGKIDTLDSVSRQDAQSMQKTNPEIVQITVPSSAAETIDPRNDKAPFTDIKVREAMQMAVDLQTIASSYYGGAVSPNPCAIISSYMAGWGFPYDQWPQDLKDQYAYNPTQAKALLTAAGYPNGFKTNVIADVNGDLTLLQVVQSDFAEVNIEMDIRTMDSVSWTSYVRTQGKTDQMAQKSGNGSLDIGYAPVKALTRFQTGLQSNIPRVSDPVYDAFIAKALAANTVDVVKQSVKDACEYEAQNHFVISLLQPMAHILCQPWLKGYTGQARSIWGPSTGPLLVDFYGSRIWIDQNLKKSKGR